MPLKIYYLDDEIDLHEVFIDSFSGPGVEITAFADAKAFLARIAADRPDLVFLDFRLPNTTGADVAAKLDPSLPKVLITGDMDVKHNASFVATFEKPLKCARIRELIQAYLRRKETA